MQTGHNKTTKGNAARTTLALCATALFLLAFASSALAAKEHLFDPVLSLTESTVVNSEDEVADPGATHPAKRFESPCGTATDPHGDIYVSSAVLKLGSFVGGRIDVFNPQGEFLARTELPRNTCGLAVDSEGNVYSGAIEGSQIDLLSPSTYPPTSSTTYSLGKPFDLFHEYACAQTNGIGVDPSSDHVYVGASSCGIFEFGSTAEGSPFIKKIPVPSSEIPGGQAIPTGIDVYGKNHDIYAAAIMTTPSGSQFIPSRFFVFDGSDGHVKCEITSADAPEDLEIGLGASVAVDQTNGDFYVYNIKEGIVYQYAVHGKDACEFIGRLPALPALKGTDPSGDIAVDDPLEEGEAGYDSPNEGYVYLTSGKSSATSHLFAYKPKLVEPEPPVIVNQTATGVTESEAVLRAELNPKGFSANYHFEYTTQKDFDENGYTSAMSIPLPDATLAKGGAPMPVYGPVTGLKADTAYRFRLVASTCKNKSCLTVGEGKPGEEGEDARFSTYPSSPVSPSCSNAILRTGSSATLPDCRAYELVTPPDTDGHIPKISMLGVGFGEMSFGTTPASPDGGSVVFGNNSGALPGIGGGGYYDTFEALRDENVGWQSHFTGLTSAQSSRPKPGGISPDHGYSFWNIEDGKGRLTNSATGYAQYLRVPPGIEASPNCGIEAEPEGRIELIGCGSLGGEPQAAGDWISQNGEHVIFDTGGKADPVQLENCAPPTGIEAIYDRTPGGPTHCVSVPPADASPESKAQFATKNSLYKGTSADGTAVVFTIAGSIYVRLDNAETIEVAEGKTEFGGVSQNGDWVFYLSDPSGPPVPNGEIYACKVTSGPCAGSSATQEPIQIGSGGKSSLVNVSADGSHVYFISPEKLDGSSGEEGQDNLYVWDNKIVQFIGTLDPSDVTGLADSLGQGLGLWVNHVLFPRQDMFLGPAQDPSRTTPDGKVLVFQSHADLTGSGYDNNGHWEIFRYDGEADPSHQLICLSCNPTEAPAEGDASLEIPEEGQLISGHPSPVDAIIQIPNISSDGEKVIFQSRDALVPADIDGKLDVYEWEANGIGGCDRENGCLSLISSGRNSEDDYLYAMTPDAHDVFFLTGKTLVGQDPDTTPSIYDARVEGGFPPPAPPSGECLGEACQPPVVVPDDPTPASSSFEGSGNVHEESPTGLRCPKGKHKVKTRGKVHCVKRHPKAHHRKNHRANANRRTAR
jgi:hypothetical protein